MKWCQIVNTYLTGQTSDESSYVIGNYKSDNLSQNLVNFSHLKTQLLHQNSLDEGIINLSQELSPNSKKDVKNLILTSSKSILGKVLSPTKEKNSINSTQKAPPSPLDGENQDDSPKIQKEPLAFVSLDANATNVSHIRSASAIHTLALLQTTGWCALSLLSTYAIVLFNFNFNLHLLRLLLFFLFLFLWFCFVANFNKTQSGKRKSQTIDGKK